MSLEFSNQALILDLLGTDSWYSIKVQIDAFRAQHGREPSKIVIDEVRIFGIPLEFSKEPRRRYSIQ